MGLFDRIKRVANANLNDMVSRLKIRKMLEQSILEMQEDSCVRELPRQLPLTNALSNSTINPKMKPTGGNACPAGFAKNENLARQALERRRVCRNCQYA